jgi:hypothetical protein
MSDVLEPITIDQFPIKAGEQVRLILENYCGNNVVNLRKWFTAEDGTLRPTRSGISLSIRHLPQLAAAFNAALVAAQARGLVAGDGDDAR